jgi:hypothetical protein
MYFKSIILGQVFHPRIKNASERKGDNREMENVLPVAFCFLSSLVLCVL